MTTPWGTSAELHRPLHGGPFPSQSPADTRREQRRRLKGAVIAAAAERGGLAAVRFEDLVGLAGVSNNVVYELFGSKQACILATVDWLYRSGLQQVEALATDNADAEVALHAALEKLVRLILDQPAAARVAVVDVYEVGVEGSSRVDAVLRSFERHLRRLVDADPERAGLSPSLATAIVGAMQMLIHDRLRRRAERELRQLIEPLVAWSLGYAAPTQPLRRPQGAGVGPPSSPSATSPPEPLLRGIAAVAGERGVRAMTVREIAARAHCSLSTLYSHFPTKEEAFLSCFEEIRARTFAVAGAAYAARMPDWPRAVAAANGAIFAYLASEPDFARVAFVEIIAAGPAGLERRDEAVTGFAGLLAPGFWDAPQLPETMSEAMAFGVFALARRQITRFGPKALPRIGPSATFFDLAPFLSAEQAIEIANEQLPTVGPSS